MIALETVDTQRHRHRVATEEEVTAVRACLFRTIDDATAKKQMEEQARQDALKRLQEVQLKELEKQEKMRQEALLRQQQGIAKAAAR